MVPFIVIEKSVDVSRKNESLDTIFKDDIL